MQLELDPTVTVQQYYGETLKGQADLKTGACCSPDAMPPHVRSIAAQLHPDVLNKFYGCGSPIPDAIEGRTILDLGCGAGRDCYILSQLVGPTGRVIGVDMTPAQLDVARSVQAFHAERFGHATSNVEFYAGHIENLSGAGVADESVDALISNCVINLAQDKRRVFAEALRVLKPGGEMLFSDVFADRRIPAALHRDPTLLGECLAGALYTEDFRRMLAELGVRDFRVVSQSPTPIYDPEIERKIGMVRFRSLTIRFFKLDLEDRCEDYGQIAVYKGTVEHAPHGFTLDDHHYFETGKPAPVCKNTADMLSRTRYAAHFTILGEGRTHFGLFDCAPPAPAGNPGASSGACC
jgi:arsenite methyltransferase